jgi:hypothetical protein
MMRGLFGVLLAVAATSLLAGPASAHHSQAMFDTTREVLFEGTVVRFDWVNPHMYLIIETRGSDGKPLRVEGEGLATTQARADGLKREALRPGMRVIMRANPNRDNVPGKQVRILDVTTQDGEIHPFYAASTRERTLKPANSLAGRWAPSRQALGAAFGALAKWPVTPAGRAAQKTLAADGLCYVESIPFLAVLDELRSIEIGRNEVVIRFDNSGDHVVRRIPLNAAHPANVKPSHHGHSVGKWEGDTLVIDTIGYEPDPSGLGMNVPSSTSKRTVERLTLTEARNRLRYEITVEDPAYLTKPAVLTQQWDHRPDLDFSPRSERCDDKVAARYRDSVPKK